MNPGVDAARHPDGNARLLLGCGIVAWFGWVSVLVADVLGILLVERHDPISETISSLAVGRYAWIQDLGLDLFALGAAACAVGLFAWRRGGTAWRAGLALLLLLAADLILIAEYNQYAGQGNRDGTIHMAAVYALYGLFALTTLLLSSGLRQAGRAWRRFDVMIFVAWTLLAPLLFVVPTAWDGAYERFLGLILLSWFAAASALLVRRGRVGTSTGEA